MAGAWACTIIFGPANNYSWALMLFCIVIARVEIAIKQMLRSRMIAEVQLRRVLKGGVDIFGEERCPGCPDCDPTNSSGWNSEGAKA